MAAARYWRVVGVATYGGADLEISALHFYDGATRIDAAATLTCSHAPAAGSLGNLQDGNTATVARFDADAIRSGGFAVQWDFGSSTAVSAVQLGASTSEARYPDAITVEYLDSGRWTRFLVADRCPYPGDSQLAPKLAPLSGVGAVLMDPANLGVGVALSNGNTRADIASVGNSRGTFAVPGGIWQFECRLLVDTLAYAMFGLGTAATPLTGYPGAGATALGWWNRSGNLYRNGSSVSYSSGYTVGDTLGCVADLDAGTVAFYKNGVTSGHVALGFSGNLVPIFGNGGGGTLTPGSLVFELAATLTYPVSGAQQWPAELGVAGLLPRRILTSSAPARVAASSVVAPFSAATLPGLVLARDVEVGGPGTVYGTTKTKGTPNLPTKARVVLLHQRSKLPVRETWSDPVTGAFEFTGIDANQQFLTLAEDVAGNFRPVAANRLTPEVLA